MRIWIAFRGSPAPEIHYVRTSDVESSTGSGWTLLRRDAGTYPFPPVHDDLAILPLDPRGQISRIATRHPKLCHGKRAPYPAIQKREEVFLLLRGVRVPGEDFHVARIGGCAVSSLRTDQGGVAHDLGHDRVLPRVTTKSSSGSDSAVPDL